MATIDPEQRQQASGETLWRAYLQQIAQGHRPALLQLHAATRARLHYMAMQVTRSREAAEEVVQDVFMHVWLNAASYDASRSGIMTWLTMLCRSRALDHLRALASRSRVEAGGYGPGDEEHGGGPEPECDQRQCAAALRAAVASLSGRKRELLVLHYYSDFSYGEIAQQTAMPVATVKTVIRRACGGLASHPLLAPWQSAALAGAHTAALPTP